MTQEHLTRSRTLRATIRRAALLVLAVLAAALLLQVTIVSRLQHHASQGRAFNEVRAKLATGTAPLSGVDDQRRLLPMGSPIAFLEIPSIGLHEVVVEGTSSSALFRGVGHRRDTVFPGQRGVSVLFGRRAAYGAPFADIDELRAGAEISVTTAQGVFHYTVVGLRRAGDPEPPMNVSNRLELVTAAGMPFIPHGVLYVDATLKDSAVGGARPAFTAASLPAAERALDGDTGTLWALAMWLQALLVVALGAVWSFHRWGRAQTWIVFVPLIAVVGLASAGEIVRLLPNLL